MALNIYLKYIYHIRLPDLWAYQNKSTASRAPPVVIHGTGLNASVAITFMVKRLQLYFSDLVKGVGGPVWGQVFGIDLLMDCSDWPESNIYFNAASTKLSHFTIYYFYDVLFYEYHFLFSTSTFNKGEFFF